MTQRGIGLSPSRGSSAQGGEGSLEKVAFTVPSEVPEERKWGGKVHSAAERVAKAAARNSGQSRWS